MQTKLKQEFH